jgi:hypothetical protein
VDGNETAMQTAERQHTQPPQSEVTAALHDDATAVHLRVCQRDRVNMLLQQLLCGVTSNALCVQRPPHAAYSDASWLVNRRGRLVATTLDSAQHTRQSRRREL